MATLIQKTVDLVRKYPAARPAITNILQQYNQGIITLSEAMMLVDNLASMMAYNSKLSGRGYRSRLCRF